LPPTADGVDRIAKLFGREIANGLIAVASRRDGFAVTGHVAHPNHNRSNNRLQYFFLNHRHIRDRALQHALTEAYRGLLTVGRFPIAFLHVEIPPDQVDVNVHPTKMEVRFLDASKVYGYFLNGIRERFLSADLKNRLQASDFGLQERETSGSGFQASGFRLQEPEIPEAQSPKPEARSPKPDPNDPRLAMADQTAEQLRKQVIDWANTIPKQHGDVSGENATLPATEGNYRLSRYADMVGKSGGGTSGDLHDESTERYRPGSRLELQLHELNSELSSLAEYSSGNSGKKEVVKEKSKDGNLDSSSSPLTSYLLPLTSVPLVIQIQNRYLVTETNDGLAIIDQHAIHERVLYEKLKQSMAKGMVESQRLLVPKPVDLLPNETACAIEHRELLAQLGLLVDHFGGNTILINGYPAVFPDSDPVEILQSLLEPLLLGGKKPDRNDLLDEMMHQMACKAAIKAGDHLRPEAMNELLHLAHEEINAHHCPHGRPSTLVFTCAELDRMFKRT